MATGTPLDPVADAVADLAARLGMDMDIEVDSIRTVSVERVTWRDSSLGWPRPGTMYAEALVPGHRIVLRVGDRSYEYHSGGGRTVLVPGSDAEPKHGHDIT